MDRVIGHPAAAAGENFGFGTGPSRAICRFVPGVVPFESWLWAARLKCRQPPSRPG